MRIFGVHNIKFPSSTAHSIYATRISCALAQGAPLKLYVDRDTENFRDIESAWKFYSLVPPENLEVYAPNIRHKGVSGILRRTHLLMDIYKYRNDKCLIVHTTQPKPAASVARLKKILPVRFILAMEVHQFEDGLQKALLMADVLMPTTSDLEKDLIEVYRCKQPMLKIGHIIDIKKYRVSPVDKLNNDKFVIGYMGNLYWWKGIDTIIEAMVHLPDSVRLKIVGGDPKSDNAEKIRMWAKKNGVFNRIELVGFVSPDSVSTAMEECHALILPLKYQKDIKGALPQKLLEYMAMGRAVIASDLPGILDVAHDNQNALIFKENNPDDLAMKIKILLNDRTLLNRLANSALVTARDYDEPIAVKRIIDFWGGLV